MPEIEKLLKHAASQADEGLKALGPRELIPAPADLVPGWSWYEVDYLAVGVNADYNRGKAVEALLEKAKELKIKSFALLPSDRYMLSVSVGAIRATAKSQLSTIISLDWLGNVDAASPK